MACLCPSNGLKEGGEGGEAGQEGATEVLSEEKPTYLFLYLHVLILKE